jgi:hypothetical protein
METNRLMTIGALSPRMVNEQAAVSGCSTS